MIGIGQERSLTLGTSTGVWKTIVILCVFSAVVAITSPAQTFTSLLSFDGTNGFEPYVGLVQGTDGNFYGTTMNGGSGQYYCAGSGTAFKVSAAGTLTTLYNFASQPNCTDGSDPNGLVQGVDGNFYGTTVHGGNQGVNCPLNFGCGTLFKITPDGTLTTLYNFCSQPNCTDGRSPVAALVQGTDGYFYGTTMDGGANVSAGTVFRITPSGTLTTLYDFCSQPNCADGSGPEGTLVQATDGNFYGATWAGGTLDQGTVFKITPGGALTTLTSVGGYPSGGVIQGTDGNFYGTTSHGGTIFQVTAEGALTTLGFVGGYPYAGLVQGTDGNLYGTTFVGGVNPCGDYGCGSVYEITLGGTVTTLYSFCSQPNCTDGDGPIAELVQGTDGNLYGTTTGGGTTLICGGSPNCGTVFSLNVGLGPFVETRPTSGYLGLPVVILGTNLTGATSVTFNGTRATIISNTGSAITTLVPGGATTGPVRVQTPGGLLTSNVSFQVTPAPTYTVLHIFSGGQDGANPYAGVTMDRAGNLYGATFSGGVGHGAVYKLKRTGSSWVLNPLYSFSGGDGSGPAARVLFGPNGTLYGTTVQGGSNGVGTVFNLRPRPTVCVAFLCPWMETVLHSFNGADGANPTYGDLSLDQASNILGTTVNGGNGVGLVYELTSSGGGYTETPLYVFSGGDGAHPYAGVISDTNGNLYGTTYDGGPAAGGTVYQLTQVIGSGWTETTLNNFRDDNNGDYPYAGLISDQDGNLYGAASDAGSNGVGGGTAFELTSSNGSWTLQPIYGFSGPFNQRCGPRATLTRDDSGNFYGTTYCDGANNAGSVFKLTNIGSGWIYTSLHDFTGGSDGGNPISNVSIDGSGNLYGTASSGGSAGHGVVWEITP